jgi:nucleoside-diphosphate-sugar epimerase
VKTALVTGSQGFAGRHYCDVLEARGYDVAKIDIANGDDAMEYFIYDPDVHFDLVIHCAAIVGGRAKIDGNPLALASNLALDATMFQWALRTQPERVVYISSSAAYPVWMQTLSQAHALQESLIHPSLARGQVGVPDQLYGWAKLTGENLAWRARQEGLKVTVIRPFSGYGEDQSPDYPFRAFAERATGRQDPFDVWGNPRQCRDWIHIDDIVNATLFMCDYGIDGPVNLGTGRPCSMADLARMFSFAAGYSPQLNVLKDAPMGVEYRVADITELSKFYTPKISLEEGVRRALGKE